MTLTPLSRISLTYSVLSKHYGPSAHKYTGPICWYQDPASSLALIVDTSPAPFDAEIIVLCGQILRVELPPEKARVWAKEKISDLGLLKSVDLAHGAGEGLGFAKVLGYDFTDVDVLAVHDAILPIHKAKGTPVEIRNAWLRAAPGMGGYASWHILSFFYSPYMGVDKTIDMIDKELITQESFNRLYMQDPDCNGLSVQKTIDILVGK